MIPRGYVHIRADVARTIAFHRLIDEMGKGVAETLGLVATADPLVLGWIEAHPELVRLPRYRGRLKPGRPRRKDIPRRVREAVFARDGRWCVLCGSTERLTIDHIVFHSQGGSDDDSNLRTACLFCNSRRQPPRKPRTLPS